MALHTRRCRSIGIKSVNHEMALERFSSSRASRERAHLSLRFVTRKKSPPIGGKIPQDKHYCNISRLTGWACRIRTPKCHLEKYPLKCRTNSAWFRNTCGPETFRVRAARQLTCTFRLDWRRGRQDSNQSLPKIFGYPQDDVAEPGPGLMQAGHALKRPLYGSADR
jgi:hypothetical protein